VDVTVTQVCLLVAGRTESSESRCSHGDPQSFIIIQSTEIEQTFGNISQGGEKLLARFSRVPLKYAEIIFDKSATVF
jgi:hypothetical protein